MAEYYDVTSKTSQYISPETYVIILTENNKLKNASEWNELLERKGAVGKKMTFNILIRAKVEDV